MKSEIIFVTKFNEIEIRLTRKQWEHIKFRHPEMKNRIEEIRKTVEEPNLIFNQSETVKRLYKFDNQLERYIMVAIKIVNKEGFVITSYTTRRGII